jgi:hypothetical protein
MDASQRNIAFVIVLPPQIRRRKRSGTGSMRSETERAKAVQAVAVVMIEADLDEVEETIVGPGPIKPHLKDKTSAHRIIRNLTRQKLLTSTCASPVPSQTLKTKRFSQTIRRFPATLSIFNVARLKRRTSQAGSRTTLLQVILQTCLSRLRKQSDSTSKKVT